MFKKPPALLLSAGGFYFSPFFQMQIYPHRTWGRPSHQGDLQKGFLQESRSQRRLLQGRIPNRTCIPIFPYYPPVFEFVVSLSPKHPTDFVNVYNVGFMLPGPEKPRPASLPG